MSLHRTIASFPAMLRVGLLDGIAYRAEMLVWIISTTMPFIQMALWTAVAREAPVGRFGQDGFVGYFLATFVVRQLTGAWVAWQVNYEVKNGTLAMRLLRPVYPLSAYAAENLGITPMRILVSIPFMVLSVFLVGPQALPRTVSGWALFAVAIAGGWLISFLSSALIGTLALYAESSLKFMDIWHACFFVFSGYLYPVELFPPAVRTVVDWLPFRFHLGFPVEVLTGAYTWQTAWPMLGRQYGWVVVLAGLCGLSWAHGVKRFGAYGG